MICKGNSQVGASAAVLTNEKWDQVIEDHRTFLGAGLHLLALMIYQLCNHKVFLIWFWPKNVIFLDAGLDIKCPGMMGFIREGIVDW